MSVTVKKIINGISFICVIAVVLVGCSSKSGDGTQGTASASATPKSTNATASENLLASIKKSGKIKIGLMGTYAPTTSSMINMKWTDLMLMSRRKLLSG